MAKYHVNGAGDPGVCSAEKGNCPFGGADQHYTTKDGARKAFEKLVSETPPPVIDRREVRFQKYTSPEELQKVSRRLAFTFKDRPESKIKVKDRHDYGLGVTVIGYDREKGEYYSGLSYMQAIERQHSSKSLFEVLTVVASEQGFHDSEKETVDWDE